MTASFVNIHERRGRSGQVTTRVVVKRGVRTTPRPFSRCGRHFSSAAPEAADSTLSSLDLERRTKSNCARKPPFNNHFHCIIHDHYRRSQEFFPIQPYFILLVRLNWRKSTQLIVLLPHMK